MYPMLLLCLHRLLPLVIAENRCEGLGASCRFEKCTMRMLVHCLRFCTTFPRRLLPLPKLSGPERSKVCGPQSARDTRVLSGVPLAF
jgi:hypothetical protein